MNPPVRTLPLFVSIALLCVFGVNSLLGLHSISTSSESYGEFTAAVKTGNVIGSVFATLLYFGLAYAQWKKGGRWGLGIGLYAIVILLAQSGLMYLALSSGRVEPTTSVIGRFVVISVLGVGALAISSFLSYSRARRQALDR